MAIKNYYVVLGVAPTESASGIRAAFRELAKYHPDRARVAYEVLSGPQRRRLYDHSLCEAKLPSRPAAEVFVSRPDSPQPEPLGPEPRSLFRDYGSISPSPEEVYERFARNFTRRGISKAERPQALTVDVVLSTDEVLRGGVVAIAVPVFRRCSACGGSGQDWFFPCLWCRQQGFVEQEETVEIELPPLLKSGTVVDVPLRERGIRNFVLQVHVRIGHEW
jgi:DnaJ-class molecular chaperone